MSEQTADMNDQTGSSAFDQALEQELAQQMSTQPSEESSVEQRLAQAQRDVLMAQAEMENFRKRMQRESDQALKYANLPLVRDLLDIIDNLNRATESAKKDSAQAESVQALLSGVEMVLQQFTGILAKYGCRPIETAGKPFDPNIHQAISQIASEHPAGSIAHEVAVGYLLHDRVVRPSCVIVSTGPQAS
jgi:molecular chaperone GrpE